MENIIPEDRSIRLERMVPYTPEEIYAAFADPDRLALWWGPNGFTNTFETFEFTTGWKWEFVMHGPDGTDYRNSSIFTELEAGKKITIKHLPQPHFTLFITLFPTEMGTRILWDAEFDDPVVLSAIRHIAEPGAEQNLDRMEAHLGDYTSPEKS